MKKNNLYKQLKIYDNYYKIENIKKLSFLYLLFKQIIIILFLNFIFYSISFHKLSVNFKLNKFNKENKYDKFIIDKNIDYDNNKFVIITNICDICGLFAFYLHYLGCIKNFIILGYIPICDLSSFPNIFNRYDINSLKINPWEIFFNQPYEYTLENIKKKAKNVKYSNCKKPYKGYPHPDIYNNKVLMDFWHNMAIKYIPIKTEIIFESNIIISKLFKNCFNNVLGILARGTDYITRKPKKHAIPPKTEMLLKDIKKMNIKYKYDWYFLSTEDEIIKYKLINEFGNKLKYLKNNNIKYNYKNKTFLSSQNNIKGNFRFMKNYLINIIILSKCLDIITARTSGSMGIFILTNGFRNSKIYYLGYYK